MADNVIGGEIPQLQQLQNSFSTQSGNVEDLIKALNNDVANTWWKGGAADRFRNEWESQFLPALRNLAQALEDASNEVAARARALVEVGS